MRNALVRVTGLGLIALIGLVGCGGADDPVDEPPVPANPQPGVGQSPKASLDYPKGAKGIGKGSIIENFHFVGYSNKQTNTTGLQLIQMADFYNPTGDGVFTEDNWAFAAGAKKPKALLIDVASVWCGPCNQEAKEVLPGLHAKYAPQGGEFLLQLADSNTPGEPATMTNLDNWTTKYNVDYPATIDPTYKLGSLFEADAFPANMIVDTRTMTIVLVVAGVPDQSFWNKFQAVIDGTY